MGNKSRVRWKIALLRSLSTFFFATFLHLGNMNIRVFVYGTLKKGQPNYHVFSETTGSYKFVNSGRTIHRFPLMITSKFNIPVMLAKNGEGHVSFMPKAKNKLPSALMEKFTK